MRFIYLLRNLFNFTKIVGVKVPLFKGDLGGSINYGIIYDPAYPLKKSYTQLK